MRDIMKKNKPIFNVCLKVILPILIALTVLVMALKIGRAHV